MPFRLRKQRARKGRYWRIVGGLVLLGGLATAFFSPDFRALIKKEVVAPKSSAERPAPVENAWGRGGIYDRNRKELAVTIERVSVYVRSREVGSIAETAKALAAALSLDVSALENQLKKGGLRVWIAEDITQEQEEAVRKLRGLGVYLQKGKKRYYPHGSSGAHILGFAENGVGLSGIESLYDRLLAERKEKQALAGEPLTYQQDLVLTLDLKIQKILEEILSEIRRENVLQGVNMKAAAYLLDSRSGALVGGAQVPGFNPNSFANYGGEVLDNMFFAPIFLPEAIRDFLHDCAGFYKTGNDAVAAGAWSVAVLDEDPGRQLQLMTMLGLDQVPEVDFLAGQKYERRAYGHLIHVGEKRDMGMIPEMSTPMNLLVAMSSLLHGASAHPPYTVSNIVDGRSGASFSPLTDHTSVELVGVPAVSMGRLFFAAGSVRGRAVFLGGDVIGQLPAADGGSEFVRNNVVFVDIPAGENPLALLLVTETKERGPFAKAQTRQKAVIEIEAILEKKIRRIAILHMVTTGAEGLLEQDVGEYGNYQGEERFIIADESSVELRKKKRSRPLKMPDLQGLSLRKSLRLLQEFPVALSIEGAGRVVRQSPPPGTELKKGEKCRLVLEQGAVIDFEGAAAGGEEK